MEVRGSRGVFFSKPDLIATKQRDVEQMALVGGDDDLAGVVDTRA
jgi:hypothetical protein